MNKRMLAVALLTALVVFCLTLVACNPAHMHDFETEWSYNETEHWHKCKGCDEVADKAAHHGGKATCTDKAVCEDCGQPYGQLGDHDWGEWQQTKAPSCTEKGSETRVCKNNAEHTETREIEMKAHSYGETWKYDATNHWKECDVCSNKTEIAAHDLGEWTVVTEATYQAEGSKERACKTCDYKESAKIDRLVAVTSIAINGEQTLWLKINETATLETTVLPENATDKTIEWTSSAPDVVEVARGRVLAHATGSATITATAKDGQGASASVTIKVIVEAESIDLQGKDYITVGGTIEFTATVAPDNTTDKTVTWTTDNNDVATINEQGTLTAVKEGQVTVTATTSNGKTATATVYVTKVAIDGDVDDMYGNTVAFHNNVLKYKTAEATNAVKNETRIVFGEAGLYITHKVTDAFVGEQTRVEDFLCTGDTPVAASGSQQANMYYFRFYVHPEKGKFFTNVYNGNTSKNYPWTNTTLEMSSVVKLTAEGYNVEAFIPYSTIGLTAKPQTINFLTVNMFYATQGGTFKGSVGNNYGMPQAGFYNVDNHIKFDQKGYYRCNNTEYGTINAVEGVVLGTSNIVEGNYTTQFTVNATFQQFDSFTAVGGLTFDNPYVTEQGNGVYTISIPKAEESQYFAGKTVNILRGEETVGSFVITIVEGVPVKNITLEGAKTQLVKGEEVQLTVVYDPDNANLDKAITWSSSDETVLTVVDGKVTAVGYGYATITATTEGGVKAETTMWVPETVIDGNVEDTMYANTIPLHNDTLKYGKNTATNVVKNETKMIFGEKGLYITHNVTDSFVGPQTHIADYICTGDTAIAQKSGQKGNMFYLRFYVHPENGKNFTNIYNGSETSSNTYPWSNIALDLYHAVKITETGYTIEIFIPYSTIGLTEKPQSINFLSTNMLYPTQADATANKNLKPAIGNNYGLAQKNYYVLENYWKFDQMGYYCSKNTSFGIINEIGDVILGSTTVVDGMYQQTLNISSKFQFQNSFSAVPGLTFDCEYITEVGNGVYKISVPQDKQPDFAEGVTVKVLRGTEEIGTFKLTLVTNVPVTAVTINGPKAVFANDTVKLTATVTPSNATNPEVTWTSNNPEVATIDSKTGEVTILKVGTVTFTATADGITATHEMVIGEALGKDAVVKVNYTDGKATNSGTNTAIEVDTVIREKLNESSTGKTDTFTHTDKNTFVNGIDGDANGALKTNNESGSYLLIKGYELGTKDFTISTWVYIDDYKKLSKDKGKTQIFGMSNPDADPISGITLAIKRNNSDATKATAGQLLYKTPANKYNQDIKTNLDCNGWHKYTVTREGTSVKIYFDDTLLATTTIAENADLGTNDICFGAYIDWAYSYNNASLVYDNVSIYDYALTEDQIKVLTANKM